MEWSSSALLTYEHVVLNAGSRVDLDLEQLCMKPAAIFRRKWLSRLTTFTYFPIRKSIYSNLQFNNTKAKLFRSIVDEYYKPLHRKFLKIMYIYSQSKSFDLLTSFSWKKASHAHAWISRPQAGIYNHRQNCWEDRYFTLACFSVWFQDRI